MRKTVIVYLLICACTAAFAGNFPKPHFAYDVDFEMNFDNREFYSSSFSNSMTIFGARLTPSVGLALQEKNGADHRIMLGVDVMKDFGSAATSDLFHELSLYYRFEKQIKKTRMGIYAGIFPRRAMEGSWSQAFFSDSLKFYDNNLEGILLKFHRPKAYFEVGCDWMGQYGADGAPCRAYLMKMGDRNDGN